MTWTSSAGEHDAGRLCGRLVRALEGERSVRLAWLHGSRVCGTVRRESDIDVAVLFDDENAAYPSSSRPSTGSG